MELTELYWLPIPTYANGGEHRELTIWQNDDGTYSAEWRNRSELGPFTTVDEARAGALTEAAERWPGLVYDATR